MGGAVARCAHARVPVVVCLAPTYPQRVRGSRPLACWLSTDTAKHDGCLAPLPRTPRSRIPGRRRPHLAQAAAGRAAATTVWCCTRPTPSWSTRARALPGPHPRTARAFRRQRRVSLEIGSLPRAPRRRRRRRRRRRAARAAPAEPFHGNLDTHYTFDNFVEGRSNQLGRAAALQAALKPGDRAHNPLLLYGGTGLGKTHLMFAAGNAMRAANPRHAGDVPALASSSSAR